MRTFVLAAVAAAFVAQPVHAFQVGRVPTLPTAHAMPLHELARVSALMPQLRLELHGISHELAKLDRLSLLDDVGHDLAQLEHLGALSSLGELASLGAMHHFEMFELPPESWDQEDPADSLWRAGRAALDRGNAAEAAATYRRLRTDARFARSTYRDDAFYWEAYARDRVGTTSERRSALAVLTELRRAHPRYENMEMVARLETSINAALASSGDAQAAARTQQRVAQATNAQCPDTETQAMAIEALVHMSTENALPIVQRVMQRRDACSADLREHALFLLSRMEGRVAEDLLIETAKSDPSMKVRQQAVFWLSRVNSDRAVEAIEAVLRSGTADREMLEQAAHALSQHRSPRAAALLREIATNASAPKEARMAAIHWLGGRDDAESAALLRGLWSSLNDTDMKESLLFAMSRQKGHEEFLVGLVNNEREPVQVRMTALHWAGQTGAMTVARLGELYRSSTNRQMREQIIFALSRRNEPDALDRMIDIARNEPDVELRKAAVFWIGRHNDPRAARFLSELIGG